jgi:hypothetical protein
LWHRSWSSFGLGWRRAERYDINPKTVAKWKKRTYVHDAPMGLAQPRSMALTPEQEAMCVALRRHRMVK